MSLWREVRDNLGEWTAQAAERGGTLARVGMHEVDRYGIHRRLSRQFTELGGELHGLLAQGEAPALAEREPIRSILGRIEALRGELAAKEAEIAALKHKRAASESSQEGSEPREYPGPGDSAPA